MTKGRRTNNRTKRKRLPPDWDGLGRGTQTGKIRDATSVQLVRPDLEDVLSETDTFLDKLRKRLRRKGR